MIKYHLNGVGNEYGADHMLTNNWNPDEDYGNEYADVHFRIEARDYQYPFNNFTAENREQFYNEVYDVFKSLGWEIDISDNIGCMTIQKGKQNLYLHPQDFSGGVLKSEVKQITEALEQHETFRLRWVDIYKELYDWSDEEYKAWLDSKRDEIEKDLLEIFTTKRSNLYMQSFGGVEKVKEKYHMPRIISHVGRSSSDIEWRYVSGVFDELHFIGKLISAETKSGTCFRTAKAAELKLA